MSTYDITVHLETNHHPIRSLHKFDLEFESSGTETLTCVACRLQVLHFKMNQICAFWKHWKLSLIYKAQ